MGTLVGIGMCHGDTEGTNGDRAMPRGHASMTLGVTGGTGTVPRGHTNRVLGITGGTGTMP